MELYKYPASKPFTEHDVVAYSFIVAISEGGGRLDEEFVKKYQEFQKGDGIPIELKIGGKEFKFSTILKRFEEDFDRQVNMKAREILEEKARELENKMYEFTQAIDQQIKDMLPKQGE